MIKTRTIKVEEQFCDVCGAEITEHFGEPIGKCEDCKRDICPRCMGIYKAEVSRFKGYSGITDKTLTKALCLECGTKFEAKLISIGFITKLEKFTG